MDKLQFKANKLAEEKSYLCAIRSLMEDDRFRRYLAGLEGRYEGTVYQFDALNANDAIDIAEVKGVRKIYKYEIEMIKNSNDRIKNIDEELALINKERTRNTKGNDITRGSAVVPKERK